MLLRSNSVFQLHPDTADDPHDLIGSFCQLCADSSVCLTVFSVLRIDRDNTTAQLSGHNDQLRIFLIQSLCHRCGKALYRQLPRLSLLCTLLPKATDPGFKMKDAAASLDRFQYTVCTVDPAVCQSILCSGVFQLSLKRASDYQLHSLSYLIQASRR